MSFSLLQFNNADSRCLHDLVFGLDRLRIGLIHALCGDHIHQLAGQITLEIFRCRRFAIHPDLAGNLARLLVVYRKAEVSAQLLPQGLQPFAH